MLHHINGAVMEKYVSTAATLGAIIRNERKKRGLTQSDLSDKTGLTQATISIIEAGKPSAKLQTVILLLSALDLKLNVSSHEAGLPEGDRW